MAAITISAPSMSCGSCMATIEDALDLDGVESSDVDLASRTVEIDYDPDVIAVDQLVAAIEDAGYAATAVTA